MKQYIRRTLQKVAEEYLQAFPAVAILGPRQVGKSTLAKQIIAVMEHAVYLDLERPSDLEKLRDPEMYFELHRDAMVCLDEIRRKPELFTVLRSIIDARERNGQFLILGSASPDLIRQTSESLAGRIAFLELAPFSIDEIHADRDQETLFRYWNRGGFPRSYLAPSDALSLAWRENFIRTFLERDIAQLGFPAAANTVQRLWQMCAHQHGQLLNAAAIGKALGITHTTVRKYLDLLAQTFMLRVLPPFMANVKKRLVKSPKLYLRDSGILHALLRIHDMDALFGHPVFGASWEGMALENGLQKFSQWQAGFYRTAAGTEMDLVLERGTQRIGIEFKASRAPKVLRGFWNALDDLNLTHAYIVAPVQESYPIHEKVHVMALGDFLREVSN